MSVGMVCLEVGQPEDEAATTAPTGTPGPKPPGRTFRLLLAEDNRVNQKLATRLLEKRGHQVTVAATGREALDLLEQSDTEGRPFDLVLMDVQMPEMDGFEATAAIRQRDQSLGRHTPVIAMTAHAVKGDRERCLAAGMDGYVAKPVNAQDMYRAIDELLTPRPAMDTA